MNVNRKSPVKPAVYQSTQVCITHLFRKDAKGEKKGGEGGKGFLGRRHIYIDMSWEKKNVSFGWFVAWVGLAVGLRVCVRFGFFCFFFK